MTIARAFASDLLLLRVLEAKRRVEDSAEWRLRRSEATAYLEGRLSGLHAAGIAAEGELAEGSPAEEILARAHKRGADLLVLSTHGRSGADGFGLGGTAAKVLSRAGVSVLPVRASAARLSPAPRSGVEYRRILVPVDGSQRAEWALWLAGALARAGGTELVLAQVVPLVQVNQRRPLAPRDRRLAERIVELNRRAAEEYLDEVRSKLSASDLGVRTELVTAAHVPSAIQELAERDGTDLVVLSAHGTSGSTPWPYGSCASSLLFYGRVPVLIFQDMPHGALLDGEPLAGLTAQSSNGWPR